MRNNLGVKTSREEISTSNEGDAAVQTLGLGQRAMAENEDGREGRQGPAGRGVGDGGHGSPAAAAHGGGGAGAAEMAAARQGRSYAVRAELRAGRRCAGHRRRRRRQGAAVSTGERQWRDSWRVRTGRQWNR
jgi:hypothetical protein